MRCPACHDDVDLAVAPDGTSHAYVHCPHPACGRELVVALVFFVDRRRKAMRWMRSLPRAGVKLAAHPKDYRA